MVPSKVLRKGPSLAIGISSFTKAFESSSGAAAATFVEASLLNPLRRLTASPQPHTEASQYINLAFRGAHSSKAHQAPQRSHIRFNGTKLCTVHSTCTPLSGLTHLPFDATCIDIRRASGTRESDQNSESLNYTNSTVDDNRQGPSASLDEAVERAVLEAYRLLQEGKVEQAEYIIAEGLKVSEPLVQEDDTLLAHLCDQLALLQFLQGRFKDAERHALRSLTAMQRLHKTDDGREAAVAMCSLRLGTILLGLERHAEGAALLHTAHEALASEFGADFEPVNEAVFYLTLAQLPEQLHEAALKSIEDRLLEALKVFGTGIGVGPHLMRAALREHRALMDRAVDSRDWELAEGILQQALRLQEHVCPNSEEMALTTYQYSTLQYVRGLHTHAEELCVSSLELARKLYGRDSSNQVALRLHRLGTLHLAAGDPSQAIAALERSCKNFIRNAGENNPLTGESRPTPIGAARGSRKSVRIFCRAALALARLGQLENANHSADPYTRILNPGRRQQLLAEAEMGLGFMRRGFGADHMLVRKMQDIYAHAKQRTL